jgi:hypothetical protein
VDDDVHIRVDGDVVGEVPGDDDEDGPAKETARTRTVCCDARRGAPCAAPVVGVEAQVDDGGG